MPRKAASSKQRRTPFVKNGRCVGPLLPVQCAVKSDLIEQVKYHLDHLDNGEDIEIRNHEDVTLLGMATNRGFPRMVRLLLDGGADPNARSEGGGTPLFFAAFMNRLSIARILVAAGARVNVRNKLGWTPLHIVAKYPDFARFLLASGADCDARAKMGWTPLQSAAANGCGPSVRMLVKAGADVDAQDNYGTPLHHAAIWNRYSIYPVQVLLAHGADINARNREGQTPLAKAILSNNPLIADFLGRRGGQHYGKINKRDKEGLTPLASALRERRLRAWAALLKRHGARE